MTTTSDSDPHHGDETPTPVRPMPETLLMRALRLRCPRCGRGKLFKGWFRMNPRCPDCDFLIERSSGYYLGSIYVNYGVTAWVTTVSFIVGRIFLHLPIKPLSWGLFAFCLIFPMLFFRFSRALWLALDCLFDSSVLDETRDDEPPHQHF